MNLKKKEQNISLCCYQGNSSGVGCQHRCVTYVIHSADCHHPERLHTELCSGFFPFILGCQKSRRRDARCQQREHHQPASGRCFRSSWPALHGPLHCYFCRGVSRLAPRAGGTLQITASERRYPCLCLFAFQTALVLILSLSPFLYVHDIKIMWCIFTAEGDQPGADVGPLISPQAKGRVEFLIQSGVEEGASVLLDGRNVKVKGYENGNFVGPTILSNVTVRFLKEKFIWETWCKKMCIISWKEIMYWWASLSCHQTRNFYKSKQM